LEPSYSVVLKLFKHDFNDSPHVVFIGTLVLCCVEVIQT